MPHPTMFLYTTFEGPASDRWHLHVDEQGFGGKHLFYVVYYKQYEMQGEC